MSEDFLINLDTQLQSASVDASLWPVAIHSIAERMQARGGAFIAVSGTLPIVPHSEPLAELADRYVREGWFSRDRRAAGIPKLLKTGTFIDHDAISEDDMMQSPFYRELLEPFGLRWFAGLGFQALENVWCLSLQRTPAQGAFSREEERSLLKFQGMLSRAATFAAQLGRICADAELGAFEGLNCACFLLDFSGNVIRHTSAADALLGQDLFLLDRKLASANRSVAGELDRLIRAVSWSGTQPHSKNLRPVAIPRAKKPPLLLRAQRLRGHALDCFSLAHSALLVTEPTQRPALISDALRRSFNLSAAEARLCEMLQVTHSLRAAADKVGVTYETARSHLKSAFAKTSTHTQSELLSLLQSYTSVGHF